MSVLGRTIFIVSADPAVTQECIRELDAWGGHCLLRTASSVEQARREFHHATPTVVFLDESAVEASQGREPLESAVALLAQTAPVVVAASAEKQASLSILSPIRTISCPSPPVCSTVACVWLNGCPGCSDFRAMIWRAISARSCV